MWSRAGTFVTVAFRGMFAGSRLRTLTATSTQRVGGEVKDVGSRTENAVKQGFLKTEKKTLHKTFPPSETDRGKSSTLYC